MSARTQRRTTEAVMIEGIIGQAVSGLALALDEGKQDAAVAYADVLAVIAYGPDRETPAARYRDDIREAFADFELPICVLEFLASEVVR